jgi:hypothetical protein
MPDIGNVFGIFREEEKTEDGSGKEEVRDSRTGFEF